MAADVPDSAVDLARRVAELETENRRLRQMLGIDGRPSAAPAWEPTLFAEHAGAAERKMNRRSPPEEKLALFRALFRGAKMFTRGGGTTPVRAKVAGRPRSKAAGSTPANPTGCTYR